MCDTSMTAMVNRLLCDCCCCFRRFSLFLQSSSQLSSSLRSSSRHFLHLNFPPYQRLKPLNPWKDSWGLRHLSHGHVNLVLSQGKPKFETHEIEPSKREKWKTKKRFKMQMKREKQKRKAANKRDPRRIRVKGKKKKQKFPNAEARIKYKIEQAKIKEALLIERLKRYEVPKRHGPTVKPENLTGEEHFYMKKMAQKQSNYVPVGRRGIFGGVILNMHLHWKKHETVKVICKPCKSGQVHEYAKEIARLSGGTPIQIIGNDTIIFYRGKNYVQPEVMSPIDTLSKKKALEKSKYEQSLESVRRFIAISEKELELYYRHVALYGDPNSRHSNSTLTDQRKSSSNTGNLELVKEENIYSITDCFSTDLLETDTDSEIEELSGPEVDSEGEDISESEIGSDNEEYTGGMLETEDGTDDEDCTSSLPASSSASVFHPSVTNRSHSAFVDQRKSSRNSETLEMAGEENTNSTADGFSTDLPNSETDTESEELGRSEVDSADEDISESEIGTANEENTGTDDTENTSSSLHCSASVLHSSMMSRSHWSSDAERLPCHRFRNS